MSMLWGYRSPERLWDIFHESWECPPPPHTSPLMSGRGTSIIGGGGGHIFIYCSQTVKTMDFKILISISKEINWA